jgi:hypothetical protein
MTRSIFDRLNENRPQESSPRFEPIGDLSTELDATTEVAAFVHRSAYTPGVQSEREVARVMESFVGGSTGITPYAEAAGFSSSRW